MLVGTNNLQTAINKNSYDHTDDAGHSYFYGEAEGNDQNPQIQDKRAVKPKGLAEVQPGQPGNAGSHAAEEAA